VVQDTKAILIDPVLAALGWRLDELGDVRREYRAKPQDNPVDYALLVFAQPRLFVEAKALSTSLDRKCASQVLGYASVVGVGWCLLTNGDEYRLCNSHAKVDVDEKLLRTVRLSDPAQAELCIETLELIRPCTCSSTTISRKSRTSLNLGYERQRQPSYRESAMRGLTCREQSLDAISGLGRTIAC
jgi:type I site-specific restriction endonuclease